MFTTSGAHFDALLLQSRWLLETAAPLQAGLCSSEAFLFWHELPKNGL